jgi:hypothetical protein
MSKLKYLNVNHEYEGRTQKQKNPYPEDPFAPAAAAQKSPTPSQIHHYLMQFYHYSNIFHHEPSFISWYG